MTPLDWLIIALLALPLFTAIFLLIRNRETSTMTPEETTTIPSGPIWTPDAAPQTNEDESSSRQRGA